jgi:hypothetical protein
MHATATVEPTAEPTAVAGGAGAGSGTPGAVGTSAAQPSGALGGWGADLITGAVILLMSIAGTALFFRASVVPTFGLVAGLTAGLGCTRWWRAALVSGVAVVTGFVLAPHLTQVMWRPGLFWVPDALECAGIAMVVGAGVLFAIANSPRLRPLLAALAVLGLILTMWLSALNLSTVVYSTGGVILDKLNSTPAIDAKSSDEDIYLNYVQRLRAGESYYPMAVDVLSSLNRARPNDPLATDSALSYRLPTLYVLLAKLPPTGGWLIDAMLVACSVGLIASYVLARQYVSQVLALLSTTFVAAMFSGYAGPMLLDTEAWAGVFGLIAVACLVAAARKPQRTMLLHSCAALAVFAAASLRELAVAFLIVGLAAALVDRTGPRRRAWIPWALAWAATAAAYVAHKIAAQAAYSRIQSIKTTGFPWFHPDGKGFVSMVTLFAQYAWLIQWAAWLIVILGMAGALIAGRDKVSRVVLVCVGFFGPAMMLFLHPPGTATYGVPAYWSDLVLPVTLTCATLAFSRLALFARETDPAQAEGNDPEPRVA